LLKLLCWGDPDSLFAPGHSILRREDCEVLLASSAAEVLQLARRAQPHLILLEEASAGKDTVRLSQTLKSSTLTSGIPIILLCEDLDEERRRHLAAAGAEGILRRAGTHRISQMVAGLLGVGVRQHPRYTVQSEANVQPAGQMAPLASRTVDLSLEGAQLEIDHPLQPGSQVTLSFAAPGSDQPLVVQATVVRVMADPLWGRNRLGLHFLPLAPAVRGRLETLLARLADAQTQSAAPSPESPRRHLF
jgi:CheY-like chemotaxis protein